MQIDLTGKKALVTGASRVGSRHRAKRWRAPAPMWLLRGGKSVDKAQAVADEIKALGRYGEAVQADSASAQAIQEAVTHAARSSAGWTFLAQQRRNSPRRSTGIHDAGGH
ncbi:hypothetical protein LNP74_04660 [Klebsiella pneumoniae subsp. pneumoniae]|nr:hypothetical protein [Klebsiella pneumoniae subsp. pneumoniae]